MVDDTRIKNIVKDYPTMYRLTIFNKPKERYMPVAIKIKKQTGNKESDIARSVRRSRTIIADYVMSNDFEWFVTFTFNPKKVNRYDLDVCFLKMSNWLHHQQTKSNNAMKYIIVPEKHKDGAIHFHALITGYLGSIKKTKVLQNNCRVYNFTSFRYGFTNAQRLSDDKQKVVAYLCKYITKDMETVSNRRRYWASRNLQKPAKYYNQADDFGLVPSFNNLEYQNTYLQQYEFKKVQELFA